MSKGLSKKSIYVLLPIVIAIWGFIIFRVLDITGSPEQPSLTSPLKLELNRPAESKREALSLNYPDPFGLEKPKVINTDRNIHRNTRRNRTTRRDRRQTQWPNLSYHGSVRAKETDKRISIISIEGRQHFFFPQQQQEQIKLLQAWNDSARVSYQDTLIKVIHK